MRSSSASRASCLMSSRTRPTLVPVGGTDALRAMCSRVTRDQIVPARHQRRPGFNRVLAQMFLQKLARYPATPALVRFRSVFRPRALFPPEINRSVGFKIDLLLEKFFYLGNPFVDPLLVEIVDLVSRLEVTEQNVVIERSTIFFGYRIDIFLGEKKVTEIQELQIAAQNLARQIVV